MSVIMADFQCTTIHSVPSLSTKNHFASLKVTKKVAESSMRSSNHGGGGILGGLIPKISKSSMRSSNPGGVLKFSKPNLLLHRR